ncbi:DDT domain-containing protein DDR4-like isoform X2 [Apium graveolens]|uniref:DDT domain-containing protein DDR4-like isoform X2 n=1 Tax=Apium graveolens TaxID=4045 RepID=UPI003D7BB7AF
MSKAQSSSPIHSDSKDTKNTIPNNLIRRERPSRACTIRSAARLHHAAAAEAKFTADYSKRKKKKRKERPRPRDEEEEEEEPSSPPQDDQCSKIVTLLIGEPPPSQLPRWSIRSMWELASILDFLNVFRPLLNIKAEFSVEEFETALITPNNTLADIHIPLLRAIPPITRMALGQNTWITVLCRKLRDWWHWVAEGELPIVASHGAEIEAYNTLDPGVRVFILKALCDIRVEQEDIRNYIDNSIKQGVQMSTFRKERIGGDSRGIFYWYEDDSVIGQRLYREIRKVEVKKGKGKSVQPIPSSCYEWETVATNLDEFQEVSKREKLLKKQHRQALLLDNMMGVDGLGLGRSLRGRKPVSYTFDDYDRSINEAIKITKTKQPSPEHIVRREGLRHDTSLNGSRMAGPSQNPQPESFSPLSPKSPDYEESDNEDNSEPVDRSNRIRQKPQRYSERKFVEADSDREADFHSDDDIVGEVVYDEEYLKKRKEMKISGSSSEGDEEYHWEGERADEEEEEEEEEEDNESFSISEDSDDRPQFKKLRGRTRRETKSRSVRDMQSGLRRSKRASRNRIDYRQLEGSDSENESLKRDEYSSQDKQDLSDSENESIKCEESNLQDKRHTNANETAEFSLGTQSEDSEPNKNDQEMKTEPTAYKKPESVETEQPQMPLKPHRPDQDGLEGVQKRQFLDLNELAPGPGFDDGPSSSMKGEDINNL